MVVHSKIELLNLYDLLVMYRPEFDVKVVTFCVPPYKVCVDFVANFIDS